MNEKRELQKTLKIYVLSWIMSQALGDQTFIQAALDRLQTCLPLRFWRKAHDFLGYLTPSGPSFHCGSVYYRSYWHFRLLKKRCQNVKILIINPKSI